MTRAGSLAFGAANVATAAVVAFGVFAGLPARWWLVDGCAGIVCALQLASGVGLLWATKWAPRVAQLSSGVALGMGMLLVSTLAVTAAWLSGVYQAVGKGGAIVLALVAALSLPYLVVLPLVQLVWLRSGSREA